MSADALLILASKSRVRARLLSSAGIAFEAADSGVDEYDTKARLLARQARPAEVAAALAEEKSLAVSRNRPGLVIGADQTLEFDGGLYDKVGDLGEARARLQALRGHSHRLHAALALARDGAVIWRWLETPLLTMRDFTDEFLDGYLRRNRDAALSSVGCYELEGEGAQLFERIDGDYFAVLGLPLLPLLAALRDEGAVRR